LFVLLGICAGPTQSQLVYETPDLRLIYRPWQSYLVPHVVGSFESSMDFHKNLFQWNPSEKTSLRLVDWWHSGNAFAGTEPRNRIYLGLSPTSRAMETLPERERIASSLNHEVVHLATTDKASRTDRFFRGLFGGKVALSSQDPVTLIYGHLTTPRYSTPRWYREGIATYLETWMGGGYGRALGPYDEMVFRSKVLDDERLFDFVGLESEGTSVGVDAGANSYLYGTRFVSYLGYVHGHEKLLQWFDRSDGSRRTYLGQFKKVYGQSLDHAWGEWLDWERRWQSDNLAKIRQQPLSPYRVVTNRALGRVSRSHLDDDGRTLYVAVSFPGQVPQISAIDIVDGTVRRVTELIGASGMNVAALAIDRSTKTLFYTSNNGDWPHLKSLDIRSGKERMLIRDSRIGDLAFSQADTSLWGVRHSNGISTVVRIRPPYTSWDEVLTLPFGQDIYDLDISPDGKSLVGSMIDFSGKQYLIRLNTASLLEGNSDIERLFEFGNWEPQNFTFSSDARYLFGSSYYSGVSNIFRFNLETEEMEPLSNAETGFFRPVPAGPDSLVAFRYSGRGFVPVMIPNEVPEFVSAVSLLGNEIVRSSDEVTSWTLGPPDNPNMETIDSSTTEYAPIPNLALDSFYPIVQGYEDIFGTSAAAVGLAANVSDQTGRIRIRAAATYALSDSLGSSERFHASVDARIRNWTVSTALNRADFYDLFGPTKSSRKGYNARISYSGNLIYDDPKTLDYGVTLNAWTGLETVPEFQSVSTSFTKLLSASGSLKYDFRRKSIGAVEEEVGTSAGVAVRSNYVGDKLFPRAFGELAYGFLLPINHSSVWFRGVAGTSLRRDRGQPFSNFYFGGFGNNWVDHQAIKRYRNYYAFPGADINTISGTNFAKIQAEWVLPPLRFRRAGLPNLYLRYASLSIFGGGLITEFDRKFSDLRRKLIDVGGQVDFRFVSLSRMDSTVSFGYAIVFENGRKLGDEWMVSLKIM
jgi:hypothetical protein